MPPAMRFYFTLVLLSLLSLPLNAQDTTEAHGVQVNTDVASAGYVLFTPLSSPEVYLIDNDGQLVKQWQSQYPVVMAYLLENGHLLTAVAVPNEDFSISGTGRLEEYNWEGELVWSFDYHSADTMMHHDIAPMPDGNVLISAYERIPLARLVEYGITVPENPGYDALLYDVLLEIDRDTGEIVWQWRVSDYLVQDQDPGAPNYGIPAESPDRLDPHYSIIPRDIRDRTHFNGLDYNAERDQVLVSMWYTSEIWVIDRASNQLVYRWGNPEAFNRGNVESRRLHFQHDPTWLPNGNILIFNNGSPRWQRFSEVIEIEPPYDADGRYRLYGDSPYEPLEPVWRYQSQPRTDFYARNVSGAQALPNGNVLITDGPAGRLFEVTRTGEIVWEYLSPIFAASDARQRIPIFKARRYLPDYPAFTGRELRAGAPLEPRTISPDLPALPQGAP